MDEAPRRDAAARAAAGTGAAGPARPPEWDAGALHGRPNGRGARQGTPAGLEGQRERVRPGSTTTAGPAARADLERLGYRATPVTVVDGEVVVGFDRGRLERLLGLA